MEPRQLSQIERGATPERWVPSTCGVCSIGCGLEVGVAGARIVGVRGRVDHPVGLGRLGPKGLNQWYANRHPTRAVHPLIQYTAPEGAFEEWKRVSKGTIPDYSGMSYRMLLERGGVQWPCNEEHPDGTPRLYTDHVFPSDWRIAESYEKDLETGHEHTQPEYRAKKDPHDRAFLIASDYHPPADGTDAEYPLVAISGRQVYHWHTRTKTMKSPVLADAAPGAFVAVNAHDAESLGIRDGDTVRVVSRRGDVVGPAKVGDVVAPGVVFVPFHWGELGARTAANDLMPRTWDPVSKQPVQKCAAVRLERVGGSTNAWWQEDAP